MTTVHSLFQRLRAAWKALIICGSCSGKIGQTAGCGECSDYRAEVGIW